MGTEAEPVKKRAPTLYAIIAIKLLKGLLFVTLAIVAYTLSDNDLPAEYQELAAPLAAEPGAQVLGRPRGASRPAYRGESPVDGGRDAGL